MNISTAHVANAVLMTLLIVGTIFGGVNLMIWLFKLIF